MPPELERSIDSESGFGATVHNTASGVVAGLVQAGVVHGGVHLHAPPPAAPVVPRQLLGGVGPFVGREAELAGLDRALTDAAPYGSDSASTDAPAGGAMVTVSAVGGAGGIGKTWLVLAWAHRHLDRFPDGQLFVDLHGFSPTGEPTTTEAAMRGFLDALGVDSGRIPTDLDAQAALYRSLVAGKRMLIVLDNAVTADQVIPLLPGSPTCTVLITSRLRLASLIDRHGARHLTLGILTRAEAYALLSVRIGTDRIAAEPRAVADLVELCGGYPLALAITARNAATRPGIPLAEVAEELRELGLEMLDHDSDPAASLPAVLSWSLHDLTDEQRTLFGLLGIAPGPDITVPAAAALAALPANRVRRALSALEEASLVERRPQGRFTMHDRVRDYAAANAHRTLPDDVRKAALVRVMDFYLHTAHTAERILYPYRPLLRPAPAAPGIHPHSLADAAAAAAWLEAEHASLLAVQRAAVALGLHHMVWHVAWTLDTFHRRQGHVRDGVAVWQAALDAAAHLPDPTARMRAHRLLGHAFCWLGLHEEAAGHLERV